jgi:hypothetical protein
LRKSNDIDYLVVKGELTEAECHMLNAENHLNYLVFHAESLENLLENPENYLWFEGVKFISLSQLIRFKQRRGEEKDLEDIRLITTVCRQEDIIHTVAKVIVRRYVLLKRDIRTAYMRFKGRVYDILQPVLRKRKK